MPDLNRFSRIIAKRKRFGSDVSLRTRDYPSTLGSIGILPVQFNRRAGSLSYWDSRPEVKRYHEGV